MKTLNRTLSLALVFALVFSLMSFAFADTTTTTTTTATKLSDFTDASKVTYTEAADYLIAAGVVKGDTATTLNPQGDLTREQAAKLIAYACLGQTAADNLKASVAPFTDVAADRWSAGYIAYCQKQGIINGYGDGTFGPTAKVTGYQYAKMLLSSMGYGVNGEFTGSGWDLEVAKLALAYGIFSGNTTGANSNAANREEAFLYTFNTLSNLCSVSYNKALGLYYVPGRSALTTNPTTIYDGTAPYADTHEDTIGAVKFGMTKASTTDGPYGEPRHVWQLNGTDKTGKYDDDTAKTLATSADGTAYASLTNDANSSYIGYDEDDSAKTVYYYNGVKVTADYPTNGSALATNIAAVKAYATTKGVVVSFVDTDKDGSYNTVSIVNDQVSKISAAVTTTTSGKVTTVTVPGITGLTDINVDYVDGYKDLAKGDYVTWHQAGSKWVITKCTAKTGKVYGYNETGKKINFNGTNVDMCELSGSDTVANVIANNLVGVDGVTAYFDASGYCAKVIAGEASTALTNFVYVKSAKVSGYSVVADAIFSDGTNSVITVAKFLGATASSSNMPTDDTFYTFTKDSTTGAYSLTAIPATYSQPIAALTNKAITTATAHFLEGNATLTGTSATAFVIANTTSGYTLYTGINKVPSYSGSSDTINYVADANNYAKFVVAYGGTATSAAASDYAFITLPVSMNYVDASNPYQVYYNAVVNGAAGKELDGINGVTVVNAAGTKTTGSELSAGTLYQITGYDNGKVSSVTAVPGASTKANLIHAFTGNGVTKSFTASNTTLTFGANSVILSDDAKVYLYDATKATPTIAESSIDALTSLKTTQLYMVQGLEKSSTDTNIAQLFVTILPSSKTTAIASLAATVNSNAIAAGSITSSGTTYTVTVPKADESNAGSVTATAAFAAAGATVSYCATIDGTYGATNTFTSAAAGATTTMYVKVTDNVSSTSTIYTVNFVTANS